MSGWVSSKNIHDARLLAALGGPVKRISAPPTVVSATSAASVRVAASLKLLSWNLLAPPYNRRGGGHESEKSWRARAAKQIAHCTHRDADIIGLQEFWCDNEHVELWRQFAVAGGYTMHVLPRVDGKRDGCAMFVRLPGDWCRFSAYTFSDWGSRVVQVAELRGDGLPMTLMNTHLTFPHSNAHDPPMRCQQGRKLAELVRERPEPLCVFGDLNGDLEDDAVSVLTTLGGLRAPPPPREEGEARAEQWVSHMAHTGKLMACDLVLCRGACRVAEWELAYTRQELVDADMPSDHRPVHATLLLGEGALAVEGDDVEEELSMH